VQGLCGVVWHQKFLVITVTRELVRGRRRVRVLCVKVPVEVYERLKKVSMDMTVSVSDVVRIAIIEYLNRRVQLREREK
jgi:Ribbon-helix-helix protein, copG family.